VRRSTFEDASVEVELLDNEAIEVQWAAVSFSGMQIRKANDLFHKNRLG
jgi:hypothetical protein